jgi:hypothetical protein
LAVFLADRSFLHTSVQELRHRADDLPVGAMEVVARRRALTRGCGGSQRRSSNVIGPQDRINKYLLINMCGMRAQ